MSKGIRTTYEGWTIVIRKTKDSRFKWAAINGDTTMVGTDSYSEFDIAREVATRSIDICTIRP